MDAAVIEMLRQVRDELAALRREHADLAVELLDRMESVGRGRAASCAAAGQDLLATIATQFGEREFLALELIDWCRPCIDQAQRDARQAICELCSDDNPTSLQVGVALRGLAVAPPSDAWRIERCGERRKTALWRVVRE